MQEYICDSLELGPSDLILNGMFRRYSYIKINGEIVKNLIIKKKFNQILRNQLLLMEDPHSGGPVKLFIVPIRWRFQCIAAITQPDGQTFRQNQEFEIYMRNYMMGAVLFLMLILSSVSKWLVLSMALIGLFLFLFANKEINKIRKIPADHEY